MALEDYIFRFSLATVLTSSMFLSGCGILSQPERIGLVVNRQTANTPAGVITNILLYDNQTSGLRCTFVVEGNLYKNPGLVLENRSTSQISRIMVFDPSGHFSKEYGLEDDDFSLGLKSHGVECVDLSRKVNSGIKEKLIYLPALDRIYFWTKTPNKDDGTNYGSWL